MSDEKTRTSVNLDKQNKWFLDEHVDNNSELINELISQYALTEDVEEAATSVRETRLQRLGVVLLEAYESVFSQFESEEISVTHPATRTWAQKCGLSQDRFVEVMKHLAWTQGTVSMYDVMALIDPESDEAVINPFAAERASQRAES